MSLLLFTGSIIASHTVVKSGLILVTFSFALAGHADVSQILCYTVRPAVGDWFAFCVVALADEGSLFEFYCWEGRGEGGYLWDLRIVVS